MDTRTGVGQGDLNRPSGQLVSASDASPLARHRRSQAQPQGLDSKQLYLPSRKVPGPTKDKQLSIPTGSAPSDLTNHGSEIFKENSSRMFPKPEFVMYLQLLT